MKNLLTYSEIKKIRQQLKEAGKKVVFTNGCFDILHIGHVDYLTKAKAFGDVLFVGLNSDKSIKIIKGDKRPIIPQDERAILVLSLKPVDYVTFFDEPTPKELIDLIIPDVLVKGADWAIDKIVGREIVEAHGGEVKTISFVNNQSTSKIINRIIDQYKS
jgi:D-beta-D-heptose 7-phosphate kinase/D-beta-D-heptose 1-phosphate adenosyltransferase